jgi:hypothetical protein
MHMTYRGVSFNTLVTGLPTAATEQVGTFLGQRYAIKQPSVSLRQPAAELVYRGVAYSR